MPSDPFQMAMIHRTFRHQFTNVSQLIGALPAGDTRRSKFVGTYLSNMISVLEHHHNAEDELLWPKLQDRTASCGSDIQRAETEHATIAAAIDKVQSVAPQWSRHAEPGLAEQLSAAIDELSTHAGEHFDYEERTVLPLIAQYITTEEWQSFIDRGAAYVRPTNLWFSLAYAGFLLDDASSDEQRRFLASLPAALRMVVQLVGRRAHTQYRNKLLPRRAVPRKREVPPANVPFSQ